MGCKQSKIVASSATVVPALSSASSTCCSSSRQQHSDTSIVAEVEVYFEGCSDFMIKAVHMESSCSNISSNPIDEIYQGVHDGLKLGIGAGGVVRRVTHRATGVEFAVKCLDKRRLIATNGDDEARSASLLKQLRDEIALGCEISHPNIQRVNEVYESDDEIFIVQNLCTGGDLDDRLYDQLDMDHYTEAQSAKLVKQILSAVCYLHDVKKIIHRDLKLENWLYSSSNLDSAHLCMIDFGLSKHFESGQHFYDRVGTVYTAAPEIIHGDYTEKVDIWAIGVITFLLLSGHSPFGGIESTSELEDRCKVKDRILSAELDFESESWRDVSDAGKAFVRRLLNPDPEQRPTAKQMQSDAWIQMWEADTSNQVEEEEEEKHLHPRTVEALVAFKEASDVHKMLSEVLSFTLLPEQLADLRREFEKIDTDGNGQLSFSALKQELKGTVDADTLERIFHGIKIKKSEPDIRYHEFLAAVLSRVQLDDRNFRLAFSRLDKTRKGFLTLDDVLNVLGSSIDYDEYKQSWLHSLQEFQVNPERITFFDFKNLFRGQGG